MRGGGIGGAIHRVGIARHEIDLGIVEGPLRQIGPHLPVQRRVRGIHAGGRRRLVRRERAAQQAVLVRGEGGQPIRRCRPEGLQAVDQPVQHLLREVDERRWIRRGGQGIGDIGRHDVGVGDQPGAQRVVLAQIRLRRRISGNGRGGLARILPALVVGDGARGIGRLPRRAEAKDGHIGRQPQFHIRPPPTTGEPSRDESRGHIREFGVLVENRRRIRGGARLRQARAVDHPAVDIHHQRHDVGQADGLLHRARFRSLGFLDVLRCGGVVSGIQFRDIDGRFRWRGVRIAAAAHRDGRDQQQGGEDPPSARCGERCHELPTRC